jgi:3-hexulose-6-phosphate synthase
VIDTLRASGYQVAVAGGIEASTLLSLLRGGPDTVVVGGAITRSDTPREVAAWMADQLVRARPGTG